MAGTFRPSSTRTSLLERAATIVPPPEGFNRELPFNVLRVGNTYMTDFDSGDWVDGPTFYCAPGGTGDGSSAGSPLSSVAAAISAINSASLQNARIVLAPGRYKRGWGDARAATQNLSVTCPDGIAVIEAGDQFTTGATSWSLADGSSVVWQISGLTFTDRAVFDFANPDERGYAQRLLRVGTIGEVESAPNSAFLDANGVLFVHLIDGREPDDLVRAALDEDAGGHAAGNLFVESVSFWGGRHAFAGTALAGTKAVMRNCEFLYSGDHDALEYGGTGLLVLTDCLTAHSGRDGLNYDHSILVLEENVQAWANGAYGSANNASTLHDMAVAVRINGDYGASQHRTIHDVYNSQSWNIACRIAAPFESGPSNFAVGAGFAAHSEALRDTQVWLEACEVEGAGYVAEGCSLAVRRSVVAPMILGQAQRY